ncbi:MAG: hypothetical protein ACRDGT_12000, partial [Candidatus Limnocylindria bacterium]
MAAGGGQESLGGDLEADEDEDRGDRRLRQEPHQHRDDADGGADADQEAGGERVPGPRPHRLVGGMADVRRVLDHAAAAAGRDRRHRLGEQDIARAIAVARHDGGLGVVDAAHHGGQREGHRQRQVGQRGVERAEPVKRRPRQRQAERAERHRRVRP